jgi:hypothetical protein
MILGVFNGPKSIILKSMEITYSSLDTKPTLVKDDDEEMIWDNGIMAHLLNVLTRPDHL